MGKVLDSVRLRLACGDFTFGGAICLVDALFFPKVLPKMVSVERQLRHSHLVVINKCDLVDEDQMAQVEQTISALNPQAKILRTTYGRIAWDSLKLDVFAIADEETTNRIETRNKNLVLQLVYEPDEAVFRDFLSASVVTFSGSRARLRLGGQITES
jgi:G3E family GTPase